MTGIVQSEDEAVSLALLLQQTTEGLAALEAEKIEAIVDGFEKLAHNSVAGHAGLCMPDSPLEWERARDQHRVLGLLLALTGRRLRILRRLSAPASSFYRYGGDGRLAAFAGSDLFRRATGREARFRHAHEASPANA